MEDKFNASLKKYKNNLTTMENQRRRAIYLEQLPTKEAKVKLLQLQMGELRIEMRKRNSQQQSSQPPPQKRTPQQPTSQPPHTSQHTPQPPKHTPQPLKQTSQQQPTSQPPPYTLKQTQPLNHIQPQQPTPQQSPPPPYTPQQSSHPPPQPTKQELQQQPTPPEPTYLARYPDNHKGYKIFDTDLNTLNQGRFLNDIIINVMLTWVYKEVLPGRCQKQVTICNSYWFEGLQRGSEAENPEAMAQNLHLMRKWYPGGHPFNVPIVVVPICHRSHWVGFVVIKQTDGFHIWGMDSFGKRVIDEVRPILEAALRLCHPQIPQINESVSVVQQNNGYDCGVWLIHNITIAVKHLTRTLDPNVVGLGLALTESPPVDREAVKDVIRGICQGRTTPRGVFCTDPLLDLLAELDLSEEDTEDEPMCTGHKMVPHSTEDLGAEVTIENDTSEILNIGGEIRVFLLELAEHARSLIKKGGRRAIFRREHMGHHFRVTGRPTGQVKIKCFQ